MKRLLLVACVLLTGTAHAEVPAPAPLEEMIQNRFARAVAQDELTALKLLPVIEERAKDVRAEWIESYEDWKERQEAQEQAPVSTAAPATSGDIYDALAMCESTMQNLPCAPYCGYFQFLSSTYESVTGRTCVTCDSYAVQKQAAIALIARSGWGQFPGCAAKLGML